MLAEVNSVSKELEKLAKRILPDCCTCILKLCLVQSLNQVKCHMVLRATHRWKITGNVKQKLRLQGKERLKISSGELEDSLLVLSLP